MRIVGDSQWEAAVVDEFEFLILTSGEEVRITSLSSGGDAASDRLRDAARLTDNSSVGQ